MPRLDILLPFALPPAELAADLRRQLDTPALATLTSRTRSRSAASVEEYARALPHERWLSERFGLAARADTSPPLAAALMHAHGLAQDAGTWFILHPVHLHIARDHLVLTDPHRLDVSEEEARRLFEVARPLFEEYGKPLLYGDARTWFVRADDWAPLSTATPDAAAGHNVDLWMPRGEGEREWRKLQNEVQMHWFMHPVNAEREARGAHPVNSLWLWGAASAGHAPQTDYDALFGTMPARALLPVPAAPAVAGAGLAADLPAKLLLNLDTLLTPALASDWGRWIEEMQALERDWFAPLLAQLRRGRFDTVSIIATGEQRLLQLQSTRTSLRKFWHKPSLDTLLP